MKSIMKNRTILILMIEIVLSTLPLSAQLKREGLIFSEVYLNENEPNESWVEIYNPTEKTLTLEKFRTYNVETINILPKEIIAKGGVEIAPSEVIIICADKTKLNYNGNGKTIQVDVIRYLGKGGFFSIRTKGMEEISVDILRYGNPAKTSHLSNQIGDVVVPFSTDGKSYSCINSKDSEDQYGFEKTEPSPGIHTEKGGQQ